jgi:DNA-binding NarL/FixJ family response regulator
METDRLINVLVTHDHPLVAAGLATTLRAQSGMRVAVEGIDAIDGNIDVVAADYRRGLSWATQGHRNAAGRQPGAVVVITDQLRERDVRSALDAGVQGYLLLGCRTDEIVDAIRAAARGARYLCGDVANRIADSLAHESLTNRESDVLNLVASGLCNKTIASRLDIAVGTVKTHVKAILAKLEAKTRTEAAAIALRRGLVDDSEPITSRLLRTH